MVDAAARDPSSTRHLGWRGAGDAPGTAARRRGVRAVGRCSRSTGRCSSRPAPSRSWRTGSLWSLLTMGVLVVAAAPYAAAAGARSRDRRTLDAAGARRRGDHGQLGDLHLRRQQRPGRRDLARLLHQPAGHRADGRVHPRRAAAAAAVGARSGIAALAVVVLTVDYGRPPWVALVLAFSFGTYGLAKKTADVGAVESLTLETLLLAPFARGVPRLAGRARAQSNFGSHGAGHALLLRLDRHRHRDPADLLRRRRDPGVDGHARAAAVPRADPPVRARRAAGSTRRCPPAAGSASCWSGSRW